MTCRSDTAGEGGGECVEDNSTRPKGLLILFASRKAFDLLDDSEFRRVFNAMADYVESGKEPEGLNKIEQFAFESQRSAMDGNIKDYARSVIANRENGKKGGRPKKNQTKPNGLSKNPTEPIETHGFFENPTEPIAPNIKIKNNIKNNIEISSSPNRSEDIKAAEPPRESKAKAHDAFKDFAEAEGDAELLLALKDFEQMRNRIKKPMTARAKEMLCNKLRKDFQPCEWVQILDQSIAHCWQDIYPLKDDRQQTGQKQTESVTDQLDRVLAKMYRERGIEK